MTNTQKRAAYLFAIHPDWTQARVAEELHKDTSTINRWAQKPEFKQLIDESLHVLFHDAASIAVNTMINLAANGDRQAAQYILDNTGYKVSEKIELSGNDIKIHISND